MYIICIYTYTSDTDEDTRINGRSSCMIWFSGLRGAIAFALSLALSTDNRSLLQNLVSFIGLFCRRDVSVQPAFALSLAFSTTYMHAYASVLYLYMYVCMCVYVNMCVCVCCFCSLFSPFYQ